MIPLGARAGNVASLNQFEHERITGNCRKDKGLDDPCPGKSDPVPEPDTTPRAVAENPPLSQDETDDLVCEPTWWDRHMGENAPPPPPHDTELRARYREHRAIQQARHHLRPPPF